MTRLLPPPEWSRLAGTELAALWPKLPETARVVVVERAGAIVGAWAAFPIWHVEGAWVAPGTGAGVARRLWVGMQRVIRALGVPCVWTGAETDAVRGLLEKRGAVRVPFDSYVWPMGEKE